MVQKSIPLYPTPRLIDGAQVRRFYRFLPFFSFFFLKNSTNNNNNTNHFWFRQVTRCDRYRKLQALTTRASRWPLISISFVCGTESSNSFATDFVVPRALPCIDPPAPWRVQLVREASCFAKLSEKFHFSSLLLNGPMNTETSPAAQKLRVSGPIDRLISSPVAYIVAYYTSDVWTVSFIISLLMYRLPFFFLVEDIFRITLSAIFSPRSFITLLFAARLSAVRHKREHWNKRRPRAQNKKRAAV